MYTMSHSCARNIFSRALTKAGMDAVDNKTKRWIYHIHSLRKYFRSKIGLHTDLTHALMGHSGYLDQSYLRLNIDEVGKKYLEVMHNVSVYSIVDNELKQETQKLKDEMQTLTQKEKQKDQRIEELEKELSYFKSEEFTSNLVAKVIKRKDNPFNIISNKPAKTVKVKIPIVEGKEVVRLMKKGFTIQYSDDEIFILEKEED